MLPEDFSLQCAFSWINLANSWTLRMINKTKMASNSIAVLQLKDHLNRQHNINFISLEYYIYAYFEYCFLKAYIIYIANYACILQILILILILYFAGRGSATLVFCGAGQPVFPQSGTSIPAAYLPTWPT